MNSANERTVSSLTHLSALSQYFIPFGNFIFPIIIWSTKKKDSEFVDHNGKQVLNFQLSIFLYSIVLCMIAVPIIIYMMYNSVIISNILNGNDFEFNNYNFSDFTGMIILVLLAILIFGFLKIVEFILIVCAAVKASNGEKYNYPLTIPFFK